MIQAFFLLQVATNTPDPKTLVRTTTTLVYGDMKEKSQKVLSDHLVKTVAVYQLKRMSFTTQIEVVIIRKVLVTRKGTISESQKVN